MDGKLAVTIRIDDRSYKLAIRQDEEVFVRQAANMINERLEYYRKLGAKDTQEAFSMVALDCAVARLKGDEQIEKFQKVVFKNVEHLRTVMAPPAEVD